MIISAYLLLYIKHIMLLVGSLKLTDIKKLQEVETILGILRLITGVN